MSKQLNFDYKGTKYTLEYTRRTVEQMEKSGFVSNRCEYNRIVKAINVAKELAVISKNAKQLPSILVSEPSVKISEKDFNRLMDMTQASGTLEKLNEIYDRELEHMQIAIAENSRVALDQDEYEKRYAELTARYEQSCAGSDCESQGRYKIHIQERI